MNGWVEKGREGGREGGQTFLKISENRGTMPKKI